jgi:hypothetical protein
VGDKSHPTKLVFLNESTKVNTTKKIQTEGGGERGKEDRQTMGKKNTKKPPVRARTTRTPIEANKLNQMTKSQLLGGAA